MGFWDKLFKKKKKGLGTDDGQAEFFREDFAPIERKNVSKEEAKATPVKETKPAPAKKVKEKTTAKKEQKPTQTKTKAVKTEKAEKTVKTEKKEVELADDSPEVKGADTVKESRATANGKFDIRKAKDGRFFFSLYASNGAVIAYSQIYSSLSAVNTGINSVIANAEKADIEDTTLKKPNTLPCPKWEIYIDKAEQYRFRLYAINGQCVCHSSHGYASKSGCKGGIDSIRRFCGEARVDKSYLK